MLKFKLSYLWGFVILLMIFGLPNVVRAVMVEDEPSSSRPVARISYSYGGDVPDEVSQLEDDYSHYEGDVVDLNDLISQDYTKLNGYIFNGWTVKGLKYLYADDSFVESNPIDVVDGEFTIPSNDDSSDCYIVIQIEISWTKLYTLKYEVGGEVPDEYTLPESSEYKKGDTVILDDLEVGTEIGGYRFLGWKMNDTEMTGNSFEMPGSDVTITSVWAKLYDVKYKIEGEVPEGYELPENGQYIQGENVSMGSLKAGDVIGEYRFLGWKTKDGKTVDANFEMPAGNVELVGLFEKIEAEENADNPKTFDNIMFYGMLLLVSVGIISVLYRKIIKN